MSLSRRSFLRGMLAAGAAPAIVTASSLMPVRQIALPTYRVTESYGVLVPPGISYYSEYGMPIAHYPEVIDAQAAMNRIIYNMLKTKEDIAFGILSRAV